MAGSVEKDGIASNTLSITEAVHILWEWRKYRNQVFWNSVYWLGTVIVIVSMLPYLLPGVIEKLNSAVLVFPSITFLLCSFSAYLIAVLYKLYKTADRRYRELLGKFTPADIQGLLFRQSIGKVIALAFLGYGIIIQILSGLVLTGLVNGVVP